MTFEAAPNEPHKPQINPLLKLALELGPLAVFFFANARSESLTSAFPGLATLGGPLFVATACFIAATIASLAVSFALTRHLPLMPFVTAVVVVIFGGLTLWLKDTTFIMMKPTIVYLLFGGVLFGGLFFGKSLIGYVFDSMVKLTDRGWRLLTLRWGFFFFFLALLNEVVRHLAPDYWLDFKVFGFLPLTIVFTLFQMPLLNREQIPEPEQPQA
jgi:intracellular septation protein